MGKERKVCWQQRSNRYKVDQDEIRSRENCHYSGMIPLAFMQMLDRLPVHTINTSSFPLLFSTPSLSLSLSLSLHLPRLIASQPVNQSTSSVCAGVKEHSLFLADHIPDRNWSNSLYSANLDLPAFLLASRAPVSENCVAIPLTRWTLLMFLTRVSW